MEKHKRIVVFLLLVIFLSGCADYEYVKIKSVEKLQQSDINYDELNLLLPLQDINVADNITIDWAGLQNYPAGCGAGYAVQVIGDTLTCVSVSGGGGGGDVYWSQIAGIVPFADVNVSDDLNLNTTKQTSLSEQMIFVKTDTNQVAINKKVDKTAGLQQELDLFGDINIRQVSPPQIDNATLTIEYDPTYSLLPGQYSYSLGYETADGNTSAGYGNAANCQTATITGSNARVRISNIPQPTDARVKKIIVYRGKKDVYATSCTRDYPVAHLPVGTTEYVDNLPEASLPSVNAYRQDNSTAQGLYVANNLSMKAGAFNTAFGYRAGTYLKTGSYENVLLGAYAGRDINTGYNNTIVGHQACAGIATGADNMCIGSSGTTITKNASANMIIGNLIGYGTPSTSTMNGNILIGKYVLGAAGSTSITSNVVIGSFAGQYVTNSSGNVIIGYYAGRRSSATTAGTNNVIIGTYSGTESIMNSRNIIIGYDNEITDKSNALNIGNIIFGTGLTSVGGSGQAGSIGIGERNPTTKFDVNGDANVFGNLYVQNNVYAKGFITASKVEDVKDKTKSLSALDNAVNWISPDGKINYSQHYAGTTIQTKKIVGYEKKLVTEKDCVVEPTDELDAELNPVHVEKCNDVVKEVEEPVYAEETKEGLDMEKRIAMLEKMIYEIRECIITAVSLDEVKRCVK